MESTTALPATRNSYSTSSSASASPSPTPSPSASPERTPSTPINASEEKNVSSSAAAYMANFENILAPGCEPSMTKEYKPQVANQFEKYLDPERLKLHVLRSEKMRKIIEHYAQIGNCPVKQIERQAKQIMDEIGLDRNMAIIRWCGVAITAIGKRICSGVYVNATSMDVVKQGLGRNPVLYLPSHRSYMDFILMSYICFHYEIEIPGIAAGMDFHSMFGMGTMLRKTGAFFMRRSFSNDELYWDIFREYMYALVAAYHIGVEFFIEGTRSRNFKALVPKVGLLSMALLPYFTGEVPDVTIVPVSVSYERVLEEQLFVYELLGVPKPKESTKGFFKALKIIDERFGKMYLDFGAPISVREFFRQTGEERMQRAAVGAHLQKLNRSEIELVKKLANEVIYQQQRRIVITTFNLLSLYYASQLYAQRSVNVDELARGICQLKGVFEALGAHVATNVNCIKPEILDTVEVHSNIVHFSQAAELQFTQVAAVALAQQIDTRRLKAHALAPQTMAVAVPTLALQLYINPCLFWLARPAYLILAALQVRQEEKQQQQQQESKYEDRDATPTQYNALLETLAARVAILDDIFKHEFVIESNREVEEFKRNLDFLEAQGILSIAPHSGEMVMHENESSRVILSALAPFLCLYYQLAVTVNQQPAEAEFTTKEVLIRMQERIEELLLLGRDNTNDDNHAEAELQHVHPYCLALDNLNIALQSFVQEGYLIKSKDSGMLRLASQDAEPEAEHAKSLKSLEQQLLQYCQLMPFKQYHEAASHRTQWISSKL